MKRQTRTELDKIVMIGMSKIDQLVNKLCDDCVTPQIEVVNASRQTGWLRRLAAESRAQKLEEFRYSLLAQQRSVGLYDPFGDQSRLAGMVNNYNGCYVSSSGQAVGVLFKT